MFTAWKGANETSFCTQICVSMRLKLGLYVAVSTKRWPNGCRNSPYPFSETTTTGTDHR